MHAKSHFTIDTWETHGRSVGIESGTPIAGAFIVRSFHDGDIVGRSEVLFVGGFNDEHGSGTYIAIDSFEGTIGGRTGTLSFWHTNSMSRGRQVPDSGMLRVVPDSGTGELTGATGSGEILQEGDDHILALELEFPDDDAVFDGEVIPEPAGEVEAGPSA